MKDTNNELKELLRLADESHEQMEFTTAIKLYREYLMRSETRAFALANLGLAERFDALNFRRRLIDAWLGDPSLLLDLARIKSSTGSYTFAMQTLSTVQVDAIENDKLRAAMLELRIKCSLESGIHRFIIPDCKMMLELTGYLRESGIKSLNRNIVSCVHSRLSEILHVLRNIDWLPESTKKIVNLKLSILDIEEY